MSVLGLRVGERGLVVLVSELQVSTPICRIYEPSASHSVSASFRTVHSLLRRLPGDLPEAMVHREPREQPFLNDPSAYPEFALLIERQGLQHALRSELHRHRCDPTLSHLHHQQFVCVFAFLCKT